MTDERLKIILGFAKFFLGTVVIGILSFTADAVFRDREVRLKEIETESSVRAKIIEQEKGYLLDFLPRVTDPNIEERLRVAQYFAALSREEGYKQGWGEYLVIIEKEKEIVEERVKMLEETAAEKTGEELVQARTEIARLKDELDLRRDVPDNPLDMPTISVSKIEDKSPCEVPNKANLTVLEERGIARLVSQGILVSKGPGPIFVRLCVNPDTGSLVDNVILFDKAGEIAGTLNTTHWLSLYNIRTLEYAIATRRIKVHRDLQKIKPKDLIDIDKTIKNIDIK